LQIFISTLAAGKARFEIFDSHGAGRENLCFPHYNLLLLELIIPDIYYRIQDNISLVSELCNSFQSVKSVFNVQSDFPHFIGYCMPCDAICQTTFS
jgi:hypothetical protein